MLFPFSLTGKADRWLNIHPPDTFTTWDDLAKAFMAKYYPSSNTAMLRNEIHTFQQEDGESLGEAWDRYQDLIASCPHHGIPEWYITQTFFQTLLPRTKEMVNASAGGGFDHLSDEEGMTLIKKMVDSEANYGSRGNMLRRNGKFPKENSSNSKTNAKLDLLTKQFEKFQRNQVNQAATSHGPPMEEVVQGSSCELCGGSGHTYDLCANNYNGAYEENAQEVNVFQSFNNNPRPPRPPYTNPNVYNLNTNFYHPGLKNHPNFSYKRTNVQNPQHLQPQAQNNPPGFAQPRGIFSNPRNNPGNQDQCHHAHAVVLRSGVELEDPYKDLELEVDEDPKGNGLEIDGEEESSPIEVSGKASGDKKEKKACEDLSRRGIQEDKDVDGFVEDLPYEEEVIEEVPLPHSKKVTKSSAPPKVSSNSQLVSKIPYPSRAIKSRENLKYAKFCDMLEKLEKRVLGDQEIVVMEEACSAHILNKLPTKLGDPGSFSIPCVVGGVPISRALCDLGASVSVIPLKVAKRIGIQNLTPTTMTLQLADRSVKRPMGVLEDVPVKVEESIGHGTDNPVSGLEPSF
ncbi:uncharacterized protein LOC141620920 [Silene latifolia]|uniref:uncharacterized protein LOC141620920 n=1 Tax=Silene latifolia TaxID=37657 RepID=UPI003D7836A4